MLNAGFSTLHPYRVSCVLTHPSTHSIPSNAQEPLPCIAAHCYYGGCLSKRCACKFLFCWKYQPLFTSLTARGGITSNRLIRCYLAEARYN